MPSVGWVQKTKKPCQRLSGLIIERSLPTMTAQHSQMLFWVTLVHVVMKQEGGVTSWVVFFFRLGGGGWNW